MNRRASDSGPQALPCRRATYWLAALAVLLIAAVFRAALITELPPGVIHDEVWERLNAQRVLDGELAPYYPQGGGREALYIWLQAASVALLGDNLIAMRLPSVALGVVLTALTLALGARLFNRAAALVAALVSATCFWPALFSRLALRNIALPVVIALATYTLYRALTDDAPRWLALRFGLAGVFLGIAPYTFPGAWGLPLFLAPFVFYLAGFERERMRGRWAGLVAALAVAALIAAPLVIYRQTHPEATVRAVQVDEPLRAALAGDFGPILSNIPLVLSMFTVQGDHGLEYNLQWRPVFAEPLTSALLYLGLALAVWGALFPARARRAALLQPAAGRLPCVLTLLMSLAMLAPTIVTSDARNPSRPIGLLATLFFFVGLGAYAVWRGLVARWSRAGRRLATGVLALTLALNAYLTARDLFAWADNPVVRFLYQDDLYQIARYLDAAKDATGTPIAIAGLTPDTMDPMSLRLLMARRDLAPGFFDGQRALLLPADDAPARILVPDLLTLHPTVEAMLAAHGERFDAQGFTRWELAQSVAPPHSVTVRDLSAAGSLATLKAVAWDQFTPGATANLLTIWETHAPSETRLRIFVHLMDTAQTQVLAQDDALGVPSLQWRPGEVFYQTHTLAFPADLSPGETVLRVGLYDPLTGARIPFDNGVDAVTLPLSIPVGIPVD